MALTGTNRGSGNHNTAATSFTITPASNFAAGSHAVLCVAYDNSGASGADPFSSISDSVGNTWISRQAALYDPGAASAGATLRIFTSPMLTGALTTSNTITVNFGANSTTAKSWVLHEVTCATGSIVRYVTGNVNAGAGTGTPTVTTTSITNGNMVVGAGAAESASTWTQDGDTTNGSWSAQQANAAGTGTSGMSVTSQRKIVSASGTQTYNPTLTSADVILAWIELTEAVSTLTASAGSFALSGQAASFVRGKIMLAAAVSFVFSGVSIGLLQAKKIAASAASYSASSVTANLKAGKKIAASVGAYALTAQSSSLLNNKRLQASNGTYNLSSVSNTLKKDWFFGVTSASYATSGINTSLLNNRRISSNNGSYSFSGVNASLDYSPANSSSLSAQVGQYLFTPLSAGLRFSRLLNASNSIYQIPENNSDLLTGKVIQVSDANYQLTGSDVSMRGAGDAAINADVFNMVFIGSDVEFSKKRKVRAVASGFSYVTSRNKSFNKY